MPAERKWCIYFKYRVKEGMEPLIDELRRDEEGIMRADRALKKIEREREKMARKIFWEKQRYIRNSIVYAAEERGREEIARKALAEGLSIEIVQKITGLDMDTIKKL